MICGVLKFNDERVIEAVMTLKASMAGRGSISKIQVVLVKH